MWRRWPKCVCACDGGTWGNLLWELQLLRLPRSPRGCVPARHGQTPLPHSIHASRPLQGLQCSARDTHTCLGTLTGSAVVQSYGHACYTRNLLLASQLRQGCAAATQHKGGLGSDAPTSPPSCTCTCRLGACGRHHKQPSQAANAASVLDWHMANDGRNEPAYEKGKVPNTYAHGMAPSDLSSQTHSDTHLLPPCAHSARLHAPRRAHESCTERRAQFNQIYSSAGFGKHGNGNALMFACRDL